MNKQSFAKMVLFGIAFAIFIVVFGKYLSKGNQEFIEYVHKEVHDGHDHSTEISQKRAIKNLSVEPQQAHGETFPVRDEGHDNHTHPKQESNDEYAIHLEPTDPSNIDLSELDLSKFDFIPADNVSEFIGSRNFADETDMWAEENYQRINKTKDLYMKEKIAQKVFEDFLNQGPEEFTDEGFESYKVKIETLIANIRNIRKEKERYMGLTPRPQPDN